MKYCFDIDGTICTNTDGDYESATPIENRINLINDLYEKENEIILFTARGSTTNIDWKEDIMGQSFHFDNPMAQSKCGLSLIHISEPTRPY